MAIYAASKHAVEGYSESVDHEVREHGVRVLLVEPATSTPRSRRTSCSPTPLCRSTRSSGRSPTRWWRQAQGRRRSRHVAKVIVAAATDPKPKLRYTAGPAAGRISTLRRILPARAFDRQIRKLNRLAS